VDDSQFDEHHKIDQKKHCTQLRLKFEEKKKKKYCKQLATQGLHHPRVMSLADDDNDDDDVEDLLLLLLSS